MYYFDYSYEYCFRYYYDNCTTWIYYMDVAMYGAEKPSIT